MRSNCNLNRLMNKRRYKKVSPTSDSETICGSVFGGMGIAKSSLRKMASSARFAKLDVAIRSFKSQVPRLKNYKDKSRFKHEISNAIKAAVSTFSMSDKQFYFNRVHS